MANIRARIESVSEKIVAGVITNWVASLTLFGIGWLVTMAYDAKQVYSNAVNDHIIIGQIAARVDTIQRTGSMQFLLHGQLHAQTQHHTDSIWRAHDIRIHKLEHKNKEKK